MLFVSFVSNLRALSHSEKLTGPVLGLFPWTPSAKPCSDRPRSYRSLHRLWIHLSIKITLNLGSQYTCAVVYCLLKVVPYTFNPRPSFQTKYLALMLVRDIEYVLVPRAPPPTPDSSFSDLLPAGTNIPSVWSSNFACSIPLSPRKSC